jgi:hypothetical protein
MDNKKSQINGGTIDKIVSEFSEFEKEIQTTMSGLINNVMPKYEPEEEIGIIHLLNSMISIIKEKYYYEKELLHHIILMDESAKRYLNSYNLRRVNAQKKEIASHLSNLQYLHESITNKKASHLIGKIIGVMSASSDLFDKLVQIYDNRGINDTIGDPNYSGEFRYGKKDGKGIYIYPKGEIFEGQCKNGVPCGHGTIISPEGYKYVGTIKDNMFNGKGILSAFDQYEYVGEFNSDLFNGSGKISFPDGSEYSGRWKNGVLVNEVFEGSIYHHPASGIDFPEKLAGLNRVSVANYEITEPGLGISVGYNAPQIWANIYVYDSGFTNIPDGAESELVKTSLKSAVDDIFKAYEMGKYDGVVKLSEEKNTLSNSQASLEALSVLLIISKHGNKNHSYTYLTGHNNHLLKIRFSYSIDIESEGKKKALTLFLAEAEKLFKKTVSN